MHENLTSRQDRSHVCVSASFLNLDDDDVFKLAHFLDYFLLEGLPGKMLAADSTSGFCSTVFSLGRWNFLTQLTLCQSALTNVRVQSFYSNVPLRGEALSATTFAASKVIKPLL
jgi:hypothetical protein